MPALRRSFALSALALSVSLALACAGCSSNVADQKSRPAELTPVPADHPPLNPLPDPELSSGHVGRAPRRITVAQLRRSIEITTGQQWSQLDKLAASLGQADYAQVNAEASEANLVFAKFLEDGAREVCLKAAQADLDQTSADKRVLSPHVSPEVKDLNTVDDAELEENLVYLSTRFWGQPLTEPELSTWFASFRKIAAVAERVKKRREAWAAICIAMMTDPRFTTY